MAQSIGVIFSIGARVGASVASAFSSVEKKLNATRSSLAAANRQSAAYAGVMAKRTERDSLRTQIRESGSRDKTLLARYQRVSKAYREAAQAAGVYGQSLDQVRAAQERNSRSIQEYTQRLQRYQNIQSRRTEIRQESSRRKEVLGSAVATAMSGLAMAAPLKTGLLFEEAMSRVRAISGATGASFEAMQQQARQLGASTVWSAKEAAEGMTFLSMAGFNAQQTMAAMPGMLSLASAGAMDLGSTADIASNILSGFGFGAEKMNYVGDVLAKTFTRSNTSIASLGESLKYCAPTASSAGQSFQDVAAMIGKMGDAGIQGSMAGTGLNAIIGRMAAPPKEAATAMRKLGLQMSDSSGKMRALPEVFREIGLKMDKMTEQERIATAKALFGAEHYSKAGILIRESVKGSIQEMSASLYEEGYANRVAAEQTNNLSGDLKSLNSAWEEVCISIYDAVNPAFRSITQKITTVAQATGAWLKENPGLARGLFLLGGALVALKAGFIVFTLMRSFARSAGLGLMNMGTMARGGFLAVRSGLGRVRQAFLIPWNFSRLSSGIGSLRARMAALRATSAQTAFRLRSMGMAGMAAGARSLAASAMARASGAGWRVLSMGLRGAGVAFKMALGPMSILLTALSFGVDYIIENWDRITPYFTSLWEGVKAIFEKVKGWMQPVFDMVGGAFDKIASVWNWAFGDNDKEKAEENRGAAAPGEAKKEGSEYDKYLKMEGEGAKALDASPAAVPALYKKMAETGNDADIDDAGLDDSAIEDVYKAPRKKARKEASPASAGETAILQKAAEASPNVTVQMDFQLNGMPASDFSNGVIKAIREKQSELESIISALVQNQARIAYGS